MLRIEWWGRGGEGKSESREESVEATEVIYMGKVCAWIGAVPGEGSVTRFSF